MSDDEIRDSAMGYYATEGGREVRIFRAGDVQAISIPKEFELEGSRAIVRRVGGRLIVEPAREGNFLTYLRALPLEERDMPDLDDDPPARDVEL